MQTRTGTHTNIIKDSLTCLNTWLSADGTVLGSKGAIGAGGMAGGFGSESQA